MLPKSGFIKMSKVFFSKRVKNNNLKNMFIHCPLRKFYISKIYSDISSLSLSPHAPFIFRNLCISHILNSCDIKGPTKKYNKNLCWFWRNIVYQQLRPGCWYSYIKFFLGYWEYFIYHLLKMADIMKIFSFSCLILFSFLISKDYFSFLKEYFFLLSL